MQTVITIACRYAILPSLFYLCLKSYLKGGNIKGKKEEKENLVLVLFILIICKSIGIIDRNEQRCTTPLMWSTCQCNNVTHHLTQCLVVVSMTSRKGDRSRAIKADIKSENSLR
jgi:hypothetical protein